MTRSDDEETVEVCVTFVRLTDRAVLVNDCAKGAWLPLSQIECDEDLSAFAEGDVLEMSLPEWLAREKGLI
jgi:hypothetical protein